jgi:hypothetical protein
MVIDIETLCSIIFVLVDDWYQKQGVHLLKGKRGAKPEFSDSEVITLMLMMDFIPFPSERQFWAFIRANYLALFPRLIDRSQFNHRARGLRLVVEAFRRYWASELGVTATTQLLLDTKPVPVMGYKRSKKHSDFAGQAAYGVCKSRNMKYFGFKLVMLTTLDGTPVAFELVPADADERDAAEEMLAFVWNCDIYSDKGFLGEDCQQEQLDWHGNRIWAPKRVNQKKQNDPDCDRFLNSIRERIEGAFNEVQNTSRNLERLLAKTVVGLCTRVIAKMASHILKLVLRRSFGIDVQTFSNPAAWEPPLLGKITLHLS